MKKLILLLLLIPFTSLAQFNKDIEHVYGFKLGMGTEEMNNKLKKIGTFSDYDTEELMLTYKKVKLGTRIADYFWAEFKNDKLKSIIILFRQPESQVIKYYNELSYEINDLIGKAHYTAKFFPPYSKDDGKNLEAIKAGKAEVTAMWLDESNRSISMMIDDNADILFYYNAD